MFGRFIECIWPRLKGNPPEYNNFLAEDTVIPNDSMETSIDFATLMYEKQKERIATIESKSSIYLGFFGAVVAILAFALKDLLFQEKSGLAYDLALVFGGVLIIYILQVMRYSIKALERRSYQNFDESGFLHGDKQKIIVGIINTVKKNYDVINAKVDYMTMAHEFTKRILWIMFIAAIIFIALPIIKYTSLLPSIYLSVSSLEFSLRWTDYLMGLVIIGLILNHQQIRKIKKRLES